MEIEDHCGKCGKPVSSLVWIGKGWTCHHCMGKVVRDSCRMFEYGHENPIDAKGSTAHIRDIKDRRWHPQEKRAFYYSKELGKTYFFPK